MGYLARRQGSKAWERVTKAACDRRPRAAREEPIGFGLRLVLMVVRAFRNLREVINFAVGPIRVSDWAFLKCVLVGRGR